MLEKAVCASIPLIHVTSDDPMHDQFVLEKIFGFQIPIYTEKGKSDVYKMNGDSLKPESIVDLYRDAEQHEYSIIIINGECTPQMLECGTLVPDEDTVQGLMKKIVGKKLLADATALMLGLTIKDIKQVVSLTSVYENKLTISSLRKTKDSLFLHVTGIVPVPVETEFFFPHTNGITKWAKTNRKYMFADVDNRLSPKGILLYGDPGTGKTEFSRYLAREWGIPLFLLDVNSMLTKWQGEAERYLNQALSTLDKESPCVVLFDEVEKLFNDHSENDTSQRLLSKILWWLQYKESNVLVVMTCNNMDSIPPELYRAGRISSTFEMKGVKGTNVEYFLDSLLDSFEMSENYKRPIMKALLKLNVVEADEYYTQADMTQWVIDRLKKINFGLGD